MGLVEREGGLEERAAVAAARIGDGGLVVELNIKRRGQLGEALGA